MIFVFILAIQWSEIMRKWSEIDREMSCYGIVPKSIKLKLNFITIFLMLMALSNRIQLLYIHCNNEVIPAEQLLLTIRVTSKSDTFEISELIRIYVEKLNHSLFIIIHYNLLTGISSIVDFYNFCKFKSILYANFQIANINTLFAWYFADILIISVSVLLSVRFCQIAERIKLFVHQKVI